MNRVLVIVVVYNGVQWLGRCLGSVCGDADVYVWDNDSTDGSADFVAADYPSCKLIRSAENLGFSIPNNKGMQYALDHGYDYVYLLNQDAWLEPGALAKLVASAEAHPDFGLLSPLQMTDEYKDLDHNFAESLRRGGVDLVQPLFGPGPISGGGPGPASVAPSGLQGTSGGPGPGGAIGPGPNLCWTRSKVGEEGPIEVGFVMAAHWLIPTAVLRRVGLFDEELFPHWGQDDNWCMRLDFYGYKIGVVPAARAVHDRAAREEPLEKRVKRNYYTGSLVRLADPRRPLWERFLYVCLFTLVKTVKYRSVLPLKYFRTIIGQLPQVKKHRTDVRTRI